MTNQDPARYFNCDIFVSIFTTRKLEWLHRRAFAGLQVCMVVIFLSANAYAFTDEQIANAIYIAEGGTKTSHPYGILTHYKHTTPRQACLNTIAHARRDFKGGDFIGFLGSRYCPVGCDNDNGTNKYWIANVKYFLQKTK